MCAQILADGGHVVHQFIDVWEYELIDPLQNVAYARIGRNEIGVVDVSAFDLHAVLRRTVRREMENGVYHVEFSLRIQTYRPGGNKTYLSRLPERKSLD